MRAYISIICVCVCVCVCVYVCMYVCMCVYILYIYKNICSESVGEGGGGNLFIVGLEGKGSRASLHDAPVIPQLTQCYRPVCLSRSNQAWETGGATRNHPRSKQEAPAPTSPPPEHTDTDIYTLGVCLGKSQEQPAPHPRGRSNKPPTAATSTHKRQP